jgi:hypothetical protein
MLKSMDPHLPLARPLAAKRNGKQMSRDQRSGNSSLSRLCALGIPLPEAGFTVHFSEEIL